MKSMNRKENKKIAVMAAIIMGFMVIAFLPAASAGITSFRVTPGTGLAGTVDSYDALVTTTGVSAINITIPAGFIAVAPTTGGVLIAEVNFWNSSSKAYYGYATITSNDTNWTTKVDVYGEMQVGGEMVVYEPTAPQDVDYNPGGLTQLEVKMGTGTAWVNITLPPEGLNGSINITIDCWSLDLLDDVHIAIKQFVRNPSVAKVYDFYADGEVAHVNIHHQPLGDIAYLKGAGTNYDLCIYTAPTTIGEHGTLTASDYWSPDGNTVAVATIDIDGDGVDEIAYLKGAGTDYDLYIYSAPTDIGEQGTLVASDYWSPDGNTVAITAVDDIDGDGIDEIAYLKGAGTDYDLYIYSAPTTEEEHGALIASDYWSPDGNTVAITAVGGGDEIAYLKGAGTDYDLYIYSAPPGIAQPGTLLASDYWCPDGYTVAITAIGGGDEIAYLKGTGTDYDLYIYTDVSHGTLTASDYWSPDGLTEGISAIP